MSIFSGVEVPPAPVADVASCMGTTPPVVGGAAEVLDDEVGLDLLLGSLALEVSSLSKEEEEEEEMAQNKNIFLLVSYTHKCFMGI